ncbi:DUF2243 domain-containing protein [Myxosarcina sp. GI1]|uniref:DUF2243 domain-containing protein n=1 Tax=Myxosarcina sp. GI1 TaxID=1541065 RepID=UPI00055E7050|nr:DUF2243 domain-containing protein [Myxosarcina sp. GI1]
MKIDSRLNRRPLIIAGILLGLGQGGFFDGIVFHQLLQWHHMFSNIESTRTIAGLELNTLGDGLFHVFDWLMTLSGIIVLWLAVKGDNVDLSTSTFIGSFAVGAGLFNVVEGILSHHLLQIHHVKPGVYQQAWDLGFIGVGLLSIAVGWLVLGKDKPVSDK